MPFYEFDCSEHGRFEVRQAMFGERKANCPKCNKPADFRISLPTFRFAEPLTVYQELPAGRGYEEIGWTPDSGISPKPGQPYKTAREVQVEDEINRHESYKLGKEV